MVCVYYIEKKKKTSKKILQDESKKGTCDFILLFGRYYIIKDL